MGNHVPGKMDIRAQEKAFAGFIKATIWGACLVTVFLIVLGLANA
jgi:hypothetical protein